MDEAPVRIESLRFLRGPNLYAYKPVLFATVDIGPYENKPSNTLPGFPERLATWLPGLAEHGCSYGRPGGFLRRLAEGTYFAHILEHVTIELQNLMGFPVTFGRARAAGTPGVYNVIVAYEEEEPARAAFETAVELVLAAMENLPYDVASEVERLLSLADEYRLGPSTRAIVAAARARRIPVRRLISDGSLVQLGWGVHQKRIWAAETSLTSSVGAGICQDKELTKRILEPLGVPVPAGRVVSSPEEAWEAAQELGLPVVVKPGDGSKGKGVTVNLDSREAVVAAYALARDESNLVLVERQVLGCDFRLLVVGGRLVAAARRDPPVVIGDGRQTVEELVAEANRDPRRREGHASVLTRITVDEQTLLALDQQGLSLASVPPPGTVVRLRQNCNLSTGGTATDVTDEVHPANAHLAEVAARALELDVAGVDLICRDISVPLGEQGGALIEVNASPGLRMHLHPSQGRPRDVGGPIVDMLFPPGSRSRVPAIAVTGTNGKTTVTWLLAHLFRQAGKKVGMTSTEGAFVGSDRIAAGDCAGPQSARAVLAHPLVEVAVLETARGGILREGLAFDLCDVGVVTNVSADHLGLGGIETVEQMARVKQVVVESVAPDGAAVVNADDPLTAAMAGATGSRVVFFAMARDNPILQAHLAGGGWGVYVDDGAVYLSAGTEASRLIDLRRIPFTIYGAVGFQVANALAATAAAWAAGLEPGLIANGLASFRTDPRTVPGRFNVSTRAGVQVVIDYGHNEAAMRALGEALRVLGRRHTHLVIGLPGDRRDQDLRAVLTQTFAFADAYTVYDLVNLRGRAEGEIYTILREMLPADLPCAYVRSETAAIEQAWGHVEPGDRLLVLVDDVEASLRTVEALPAPGMACDRTRVALTAKAV